MHMTPDNYFIGEGNGLKNVGGIYNSFMYFEAGKENTEGNSNVFLGYGAGISNTGGNSNVFVGNESGLQMDFVAQEALKVIPEVVKGSEGSYSMQYTPVSALLVEAIKEQQKIIEAQKTKINDQETQLKLIQSRLEQIKTFLQKAK
jgi:hypothetical protein